MLQLKELFEPIKAKPPCGEDLTFSIEVDAINKARQFDDPSLDQGEWVVAIKEADWNFVFDKCASLLTLKTKDLRLCGWLTEAAAKTRQFEGLAAGFELISVVCDRYWTDLFPQAEDGDLEQRIGNVSWLISRASQLVREVPLTEGNGTAYSTVDFEAARARANAASKSGETLNPSAREPDIALLEAARRKSSKKFYEALFNSGTHCKLMLSEMERSLDERLGIEGPVFSQLKDTLDDIIGTIQRFAVDVGVKGLMAVSGPDGAVVANTADDEVRSDHPNLQSNVSFSRGRLTSRDQAIEQLRQVAEFFRLTEPHSPVAYLADKAASWGDLPLHAWLRTVVKDPASLNFIEEMLGVKPGDAG